MGKYNKGVVFSFDENNPKYQFTVIDSTTIDNKDYFLAVPIQTDKNNRANLQTEKVVAFREYEDETLSTETDAKIVTQIVKQILTSQNEA